MASSLHFGHHIHYHRAHGGEPGRNRYGHLLYSEIEDFHSWNLFFSRYWHCYHFDRCPSIFRFHLLEKQAEIHSAALRYCFRAKKLQFTFLTTEFLLRFEWKSVFFITSVTFFIPNMQPDSPCLCRKCSLLFLLAKKQKMKLRRLMNKSMNRRSTKSQKTVVSSKPKAKIQKMH